MPLGVLYFELRAPSEAIQDLVTGEYARLPNGVVWAVAGIKERQRNVWRIELHAVDPIGIPWDAEVRAELPRTMRELTRADAV